jgi:hypothetical protein
MIDLHGDDGRRVTRLKPPAQAPGRARPGRTAYCRRQSNMPMTGISSVSTPSTAFSSGFAGSTVAT